MGIMKSFAYTLALFVICTSQPVMAAGFDCTKAATSREKVTCYDPTLSELDEQLDRTYKNRRSLLSQHGAELLQRSEKSWLRYITDICSSAAPEDTDISSTSAECLEREYKSRLEQLSEVGKKLGPFVFNRIDLFAVMPTSKDANEQGYKFSTQQLGFPQIDNSNSPITDLWNKRAQRTLPLTGDCGHDAEYVSDYYIQYASKNLISTTWYDYEYCYGAAHGLPGNTVENLVLRPALHELKASEIFGAGDDWIVKFQNLVLNELQKQANTLPEIPWDEERVLAFAVEPTRWAFTSEGIKISYGAYEVGCYICSPEPIILTWGKLKPLLAPNAIVP